MQEIRKQYEEFVYPAPIRDLDEYLKLGGMDLSDPSLIRRKLWPRSGGAESLNILVAGCGANQAAVIARKNPECRVMGIDISRQAVEHHRMLKKKHKLKNLDVRELAVENVGKLEQKYDLVICTGVLHHLNSPLQGLSALGKVLAKTGVMSVMVYGKYGRQGVYCVQEALRRLGAGADKRGLVTAQEAMRMLPEWHQASTYIKKAPDLSYDAGIVDTFLNVQDRAFSIPEIMTMVESAGLQFQSWLDGLYYSPSAVFSGSAILEEIEKLPLVEQWHVVDLLTQAVGAHRFLVCNPNNMMHKIKFDGDWLSLCPSFRYDLKMSFDEDERVNLSREWQNIGLSGFVVDVLKKADGMRSFNELIVGLNEEQADLVKAVFMQLHEWDHVHVRVLN